MKSKKDILFLCQFFYPEYVSSATLPYDTALRLCREGWSVGVICGFPKEYSQGEKVTVKENVNGIDIHRLRYIQCDRKNKFGRILNYFSFSISLLLHIHEIRKYKSIIVYSSPPVIPLVGVAARKLFGVKFVFVAYDLYPEIAIKTGTMKSNGMISCLMNWINKCVFHSVDNVITLSNEMKRFIIANRNIDSEKVVVIPNWFKDESNRTCKGCNNMYYEKYKDKFVASYFGNMGTCQDIETLENAILLLKDCVNIRFFFAGHGNKMEQLREFIVANGCSNVDVSDFLHGKAYLDALCISSCAIVSLIKGITGLCVPSKTYGYMMSAVPLIVIMDDSDISCDIIENKAGYVINNGEAIKLAETLVSMSNDSERLALMGRNSRSIFVEKYTTEVCTEQYISVFKKLL